MLYQCSARSPAKILRFGIFGVLGVSGLQGPLGLWGLLGFIVNPRKLEHGFRRISARIPYTLP